MKVVPPFRRAFIEAAVDDPYKELNNLKQEWYENEKKLEALQNILDDMPPKKKLVIFHVFSARPSLRCTSFTAN